MTVDVDVIRTIDSIKNPISGNIIVNNLIHEIFFDDSMIKKKIQNLEIFLDAHQ